MPGFAVKEVVDTVGAGDGFAVGVVSALLEGRSAADAVRRGAWIGARAVQVLGDTEGLPTPRRTRGGRTMSGRRNQVLVFRELPPDQLARLQQVHDVTVANPRVPGQKAAFEAALPASAGTDRFQLPHR